MIRVYPEQLVAQLHEGLRACYLLCGNEPLLLQESQDHIRHVAAQHDFSEHFSFALDAHTEWDNIFSLCQALSLFASRQILLLSFPDSGLTAPMNEQLVKLSGLLHPDILLILRANKLTKAQENSAWFKALSKNGVFVSCQTPDWHNCHVGLALALKASIWRSMTRPFNCCVIATKATCWLYRRPWKDCRYFTLTVN